MKLFSVSSGRRSASKHAKNRFRRLMCESLEDRSLMAVLPILVMDQVNELEDDDFEMLVNAGATIESPGADSIINVGDFIMGILRIQGVRTPPGGMSIATFPQPSATFTAVFAQKVLSVTPGSGGIADGIKDVVLQMGPPTSAEWSGLGLPSSLLPSAPGTIVVMYDDPDDINQSLPITAAFGSVNGTRLWELGFKGLPGESWQLQLDTADFNTAFTRVTGEFSPRVNVTARNGGHVLAPQPVVGGAVDVLLQNGSIGSPAPGSSFPVSSDVDFWLKPTIPASLGDFVWHDKNANGVQDNGEPGIPNAKVNLKNGAGVVIDTTTTDASGLYSFTNLPPGTYSVQFVLPAGYTTVSPLNAGGDDTKDSDGDTAMGLMTATVTLASGDNNTTLDQGFYNLAALGDFVWHDKNANGVQDNGEPGIPSAKVNLKNGAGVVIGTTTTDANGLYSFTNLTPGTYSVQFVVPAGFNSISPLNVGGNDTIDSDGDPAMSLMTATVVLASGDNNTTLDQGFYNLVVVHGGCTPGFWKNNAANWNASAWPTSVRPSDPLSSEGFSGFTVQQGDSTTFLNALGAGGGGENALMRHAAAALLNSLTQGFPLTAAQIVQQVNAALAMTPANARKSAIETLKNQLDEYNNAGCGFDQHGRPIGGAQPEGQRSPEVLSVNLLNPENDSTSPTDESRVVRFVVVHDELVAAPSVRNGDPRTVVSSFEEPRVANNPVGATGRVRSSQDPVASDRLFREFDRMVRNAESDFWTFLSPE